MHVHICTHSCFRDAGNKLCMCYSYARLCGSKFIGPGQRRSRIVCHYGAPQCHGGSALPLALRLMLLAVLLLLLLLQLLPRHRAHRVGSRLMHRPTQGTTMESSNGVHGRSRCLHVWQHAMTLGAGALQCWVSVCGSSRRLHQQRHPTARSPVPGRNHCSHHIRIRTNTHNKRSASSPPHTSERGAKLQQSTHIEETTSRPPSERGAKIPQSTHNEEKVSRAHCTRERWARLQQRG